MDINSIAKISNSFGVTLSGPKVKEKIPVLKSATGIENALKALAANNRAGVKAISLDKLKQQINFLMNEKTNAFYSSGYKTRAEVEDFELGKSVMKLFLDSTPEECTLSEKEYRQILSSVKEKGFLNSKLKDSFLNQEDLLEEIQMCTDEFPYGFLAEKYYSQAAKANPDLNKIESLIKDRTIDSTPPSLTSGKVETILKDILSESKDLTLDGSSLIASSYKDNEVYDFPLKFAAASYNKLAKDGSAYIQKELPEVFDGLDEKEVQKALDLFSLHTRGTQMKSFPAGSKLKFNIGDKEFSATAFERGNEGSVFKIERNGKSAVLKNFYADSDISSSGVNFSPEGLYGGLGVLNEANLAGVVDVPKLYMANPVFKPVDYHGDKHLGGWMLMEDANKRQASSDGLKFYDWLKEKGLSSIDDKSNGWVNGVCVDTGFICPTNNALFDCGHANKDINNLFSQFIQGKTVSEIANGLS